MLNRTIAPANHPVLSVQLPPAQVYTLNNGARLHCLPGSGQPVVKLEIIFKAGKWQEPAAGVSYLTAKMLLEGTTAHSAKQIADIIAFYGASLECSQGFDRSSVTLYCLSKHLAKLLPLVNEILTSASFPLEEFNLLKSRTIQNISIEKQKTSYLATAVLTRNIYGEDHPYVAGMEESILTSIDQEQVRLFYQTHYTFQEAEIILSGDFEEEDRHEMADLFGRPASPLPADIRAKPAIIATSHSAVDLPDKLQSSIRIGRRWPLMNHPDFSKLSMVNKILGGYFGSRLMKNIREEKGLTYGIFSAVSPKESDSLFYIGTDVSYEKAPEAVSEILKEIGILKNELVSEEELETVKAYIVGKFINDTASIFDQSEKYKTIVLHALPNDYYTHYLREIQSMTAGEIPALMEKYLSEDTLSIVVVGKDA